VGPYSMILPEPCEARRVLETKALQAASSGLESRVERPSHCHQNRGAGFPGLAGFKPAPPKKKTPLRGKKYFAARAKTHPRNPRLPQVAVELSNELRIDRRGLFDESGGYNTHFTLRNLGREVEEHRLRQRVCRMRRREQLFAVVCGAESLSFEASLGDRARQ
jgi:hypothetical protein